MSLLSRCDGSTDSGGEICKAGVEVCIITGKTPGSDVLSCPTNIWSIRSMSSLGISHSDRSDMEAVGEGSRGLLSLIMCRELPHGGTPANTDTGLPDDNDEDSGEAIRGDVADDRAMTGELPVSVDFHDCLIS